MGTPRSADDAAAAPVLDRAGLDGLVGFQLRQAFLWSNQLFAKAMSGRDLAPGQFGALKVVAANPGCTPSALAAAIGLDPSSLTPTLAQLDDRGLLERRPGADRRQIALQASEAGVQALAQAEADVLRHDATVTAALKAREREELLALLGKLLSARAHR